MCVSAVVLILIFSDYILRQCYKNSAECLRDNAVQAALALLVLLLGHAIRAFSGWMQFLWMRSDWDPDFWANGIDLFLAATVLIVTGKIFMIYIFVPHKWRWTALFTVTCAVTVPVLVAILV